jgi:hypothetical protein
VTIEVGLDEPHSVVKRESFISQMMNSILGRRPAHAKAAPTTSVAQSSSYGAPPPSYDPPTEKPVRVVYRKFGYVCEVEISREICRIGTECDQNGNPLRQ